MFALTTLALAGLFLPDLGKLEQDLRDADAGTRRQAVAGLAELGTDEAWALVFGALRDDDAKVADEAQLTLGDSASEFVRQGLIGKTGLGSGDERIVARALEALGRLPQALDGAPIVAELRAKDAQRRRLACWTIERRALAGRALAGEGVVAGLQQLAARDKDAELRAAALLALAVHAPAERDGAMRACATSRDVPLAIAAIEIAVLAAGEERGDLCAYLATMAAHGERAVRTAAVGELAELALAGARKALPALVDRLEQETNTRTAHAALEALRRASGLRHGGDPRPWREWLEALPQDWRPERDAQAGDAPTKASFVGLPLFSERLAFLIDFSGSTWQEREGGTTRKQRLDRELRTALEALDEATHFTLVPYTDRPSFWKPDLVPADARTVDKALDWFESQRTSGTGDFLEAALAALALAVDDDGELDTIVTLTDGAPTGGEHWNLRLIVPWLLERNRFRRVAFDVVLVDASKGLQRFWEELARASGGRVHAVQLDR